MIWKEYEEARDARARTHPDMSAARVCFDALWDVNPRLARNLLPDSPERCPVKVIEQVLHQLDQGGSR
jgi:hypothetical protein